MRKKIKVEKRGKDETVKGKERRIGGERKKKEVKEERRRREGGRRRRNKTMEGR